jgi:low temperature requirement protein LtrA
MEAAAESPERARRLTAVLREGERVTPLELFFDLVFVLALTQCTQLMADHPTWEGLEQGMLVLGVLWWSWTGYAWLTSVVDPEEGAVRIAMFAAMAALLVVSLCVPEAFGGLALEFTVGYAVVRAAHIALFILASRDDPGLRQSVLGLGVSTAIGVGILACASFFDGAAQIGIWAFALLFDMALPYFVGTEGWRLVPLHFAERHGLVLIIALGESIVAIGAGAEHTLDLGIAAAAVAGIALATAIWWMYFDVVALVSARRLARAEEGLVRNALARDSYSYIHYPMVAGIVLMALGLKKTLGDVDAELKTPVAFALIGGVALYVLALVGFRYRHIRSVNRRRLGLGLLLLALIPLAIEIPALAALAIVTVLVWAVVVYDTRVYGEGRWRARHEEFAPEAP